MSGWHENDLRWGDNNVIDDLTGFKIKASEARVRWDGMVTHRKNWETRHPSDFLRSQRDDQSVRHTSTDDDNLITTDVLAADLAYRG